MNNVNSKLYERLERFQKILKQNKLECPLPGVAVYKSIDDFDNLKNSVLNFILTNLEHSFPNEKFSICDDFLDKYYDFIINLPNKTPNGLLLFQKRHKMLIIRCTNFFQKLL